MPTPKNAPLNPVPPQSGSRKSPLSRESSEEKKLELPWRQTCRFNSVDSCSHKECIKDRETMKEILQRLDKILAKIESFEIKQRDDFKKGWKGREGG